MSGKNEDENAERPTHAVFGKRRKNSNVKWLEVKSTVREKEFQVKRISGSEICPDWSRQAPHARARLGNCSVRSVCSCSSMEEIFLVWKWFVNSSRRWERCARRKKKNAIRVSKTNVWKIERLRCAAEEENQDPVKLGYVRFRQVNFTRFVKLHCRGGVYGLGHQAGWTCRNIHLIPDDAISLDAVMERNVEPCGALTLVHRHALWNDDDQQRKKMKCWNRWHVIVFFVVDSEGAQSRRSVIGMGS